MSEPQAEPLSRRERNAQRKAERQAEKARGKAQRRGASVLKGTFALLRRDAGNTNPETRRLLGAAKITSAELQQLAHLTTAAQFRPDLYGEQARQAQAMVAGRLEAARTAPTSRWRARQDRKQGTNVMKAAYTQLGRDVKNRDARLLQAVGGMPFNKHDLRDLVRSDMNAIIRRGDQFADLPGRGAQTQPMVVQSQSEPAQAAPAQAGPVAQPQQVSAEVETLQQLNQAYVEMNELMGRRIEALQAQVEQLSAQVQQLAAQQAALQPNQQPQPQAETGAEAPQPQPAPQAEAGAEAPQPQPQPQAEAGAVAPQPAPQAEAGAEAPQPQPQPAPQAEAGAEAPQPQPQPQAEAGAVAPQPQPQAEAGAVAPQPQPQPQAEAGGLVPQPPAQPVVAREGGGGRHRAPEVDGPDPKLTEAWVNSAHGENATPLPPGAQPAAAEHGQPGQQRPRNKADLIADTSRAMDAALGGPVAPPERSTREDAENTTGSAKANTGGQRGPAQTTTRNGPKNQID